MWPLCVRLKNLIIPVLCLADSSVGFSLLKVPDMWQVLFRHEIRQNEVFKPDHAGEKLGQESECIWVLRVLGTFGLQGRYLQRQRFKLPKR